MPTNPKAVHSTCASLHPYTVSHKPRTFSVCMSEQMGQGKYLKLYHSPYAQVFLFLSKIFFLFLPNKTNRAYIHKRNLKSHGHKYSPFTWFWKMEQADLSLITKCTPKSIFRHDLNEGLSRPAYNFPNFDPNTIFTAVICYIWWRHYNILHKNQQNPRHPNWYYKQKDTKSAVIPPVSFCLTSRSCTAPSCSLLASACA